jgi:hypothetical protein
MGYSKHRYVRVYNCKHGGRGGCCQGIRHWKRGWESPRTQGIVPWKQQHLPECNNQGSNTGVNTTIEGTLHKYCHFEWDLTWYQGRKLCLVRSLKQQRLIPRDCYAKLGKQLNLNDSWKGGLWAYSIKGFIMYLPNCYNEDCPLLKAFELSIK